MHDFIAEKAWTDSCSTSWTNRNVQEWKVSYEKGQYIISNYYEFFIFKAAVKGTGQKNDQPQQCMYSVEYQLTN